MNDSSETTSHSDIINLGGERFRLIDGTWHWYINQTRWAAEGDETLCDALHEINRLRAENQAFRDQFREADEIAAEWEGHTPSNPPPGWVMSPSPFEEDYWK